MRFFLVLIVLLLFAPNAVSQNYVKENNEISDLIYKNQYTEAQTYIYRLMNTQKPDKYEQVLLKLFLSDIQRLLAHPKKAAEYSKEALQISFRDGTRGLRSRGYIFHKIANLFYERKVYDSAYFYARKSMLFAEKYNRKEIVTDNKMINLPIIGYYYLVNNNPKLAKETFLQSIKLFTENGSECETSLQYNKLSDVAISTNNLNEAENYGLKALKIAADCRISSYEISAVNKLIEIYKLQNNAAKLYQYFKQKEMLMSAIKFDEQRKNLLALEVKYQSQIREKENKLLKIQNVAQANRSRVFIVIIILSAMILIGFMLIAFYLQRKNRLIRKQKNELEKLNTLNQKIFSIISHDFKSPLTNLQQTIELTENEVLDFESFPMLAYGIKQQINQTTLILENLLSWAQSEMNDAARANVLCQPKLVAAETILQLEMFLNRKNLTVEIDIPNNLLIKIPSEILKIVYRNIISNAIKYSYENGQIEIGYEQAESYFFVKDNGAGISEKNLQRLFTNKVQSAQGTSAETGYGIGLHITYEMIRKFGGEIWAENNPEKGAIIKFTIPLQK
ncbi:sensor histidine kinase [Flavobacterium noncentrifugens]|uniref:histidine kinase n=1 Tax=Flavobacterium noncentrifugens TaxID=1128970 RepID=A0A1G9CCS5_9FLAO|nr:HAMP domain-containing sensor histidine kinase [Flavobacterium noncentrifugens]SDK49488.1 Histidine kinase-, DNA gyrase B-, and HSP90-like ATPase [Flavobacterium noncentrifugens]